jgi:putative membrane protein
VDRSIELDELVEHWTLFEDELELVACSPLRRGPAKYEPTTQPACQPRRGRRARTAVRASNVAGRSVDGHWTRHPVDNQVEPAKEILKRRYASGEIDEDEYLRRLSGIDQN